MGVEKAGCMWGRERRGLVESGGVEDGGSASSPGSTR